MLPSEEQEPDDPTEVDPDIYECESCEYRQRREQLTEFDLSVLDLHRKLTLRVVKELKLTELVFETARAQVTPEEAEILIDLLDEIHTIRCPPRVDSQTDPEAEDEES